MSTETSTETTSSEGIEMELSIEFRPRDGDHIAVRPLILGRRPLILIEFSATQESLRIEMDVTGFEDEDGKSAKEPLIEMLEVILDGLKREEAVVKTEVR